MGQFMNLFFAIGITITCSDENRESIPNHAVKGKIFSLSDFNSWFLQRKFSDFVLELGKLASATLKKIRFLLFSILASCRHTEAQFELGLIYLEEREDVDKASKWFDRAAEQGHHKARRARAFLELYLKEQDELRSETIPAVKWCELAAVQGDPDAQFRTPKLDGELENSKLQSDHTQKDQLNLGKAFLHGLGVPKDTQEAIKWFKLAAEPGQSSDYLGEGGRAEQRKLRIEALMKLGEIYHLGVDGEFEDLQESRKWYELGASQGILDAQIMVSEIDRKLRDLEF